MQAFKSGKYEEAVDYFQKSIALDPSNPNGHLYLATALSYQVVPDLTTPENLAIAQKALNGFNDVLAQNPNDLDALRQVASIHRNIKKYDLAKADELKSRYALSKQQLDISADAIKAQLDAQKVQIEKLNAAWDLKKKQVQELVIRAGVDGVLQQLGAGAPAPPLEVGQRVAPGTILAKVAQPSKLKAELQIPETQAKDVTLGQVASIDTRNGIIAGHVRRKDPAAINGTITVDVSLEGNLPEGAVPDLSVDGVITIEKLADVVYVGRPVIGQAGAKITLFKLDPESKEAIRVPVTLGRSSVNTIEIVDGLKVGDQVILSDMSAWDAHNRIRLK